MGLMTMGLMTMDLMTSGGDDNSGSGGNGGGAGRSPEPAKNVKSKELCQQFISNGKQICFKFIKGVTSVEYVKFNAKKTAGKITTIVEDLKGRSSLTLSETPRLQSRPERM